MPQVDSGLEQQGIGGAGQEAWYKPNAPDDGFKIHEVGQPYPRFVFRDAIYSSDGTAKPGAHETDWTDFSSSVSLLCAGASPVQPVIGSSGYKRARYRRLGATTIQYQGHISSGVPTDTPAATGGSGGYYVISLPVAAVTSVFAADRPIGTGYVATLLHGMVRPIRFCVADPSATLPDPFNKVAMMGFCEPTRRRGQATVANASKSIVVNHGLVTPLGATLNGAPYLADIVVKPLTRPSASGCVEFWVDNITTTQFTINAVATANGNLTASLAFEWSAEMKADPTTGLQQGAGMGPEWFGPNNPIDAPTAWGYGVFWDVSYEVARA